MVHPIREASPGALRWRPETHSRDRRRAEPASLRAHSARATIYHGESYRFDNWVPNTHGSTASVSSKLYISMSRGFFFFIIAIHGDTLEMWAVSLPSPNKSVWHYLYKLSMDLIKFSTFRSKIYICPMHPKSTNLVIWIDKKKKKKYIYIYTILCFLYSLSKVVYTDLIGRRYMAPT